MSDRPIHDAAVPLCMWSVTKLAVDNTKVTSTVESDRHALTGFRTYALAIRNTPNILGQICQFFDIIEFANVVRLHQLENWND